MAGKGSGRLHTRTDEDAIARRWPFAAPEREWNRASVPECDAPQCPSATPIAHMRQNVRIFMQPKCIMTLHNAAPK